MNFERPKGRIETASEPAMTTFAAPHPSAPPLHHVRRISRLMVAACWALLVLLPLALAWYWATANDALLVGHANLPNEVLRLPLHAWQRWSAGAVMALPLALLLLGVWQARRCFVLFAQGKVFTVQATDLLRRFAGWVAAAAFAALLASAVTSVLLTLHHPPGMRHLAIGISSSHVFTLFFAGMVWLMAAVIGQGQALADENQSFV